MHRRNILTAVLAGAGVLFAAATCAAPRQSGDGKSSPCPVQNEGRFITLPISTRFRFVLGNIRNHYDGVGGPDKVTIALVVHGPALKAFKAASAAPDFKHSVGEFSKSGLEMNACGNTMRAQKITLADLLPGFLEADKGGVVRLAELQGQGYVYLRP